jgi:xanthine dehydrogenase YagR molybdenum-binding subunit
MALHERTVTDRATGCIIGKSLTDYLTPVHADMPEFDIATIEEDDPHLPGGVKGISMLGTAGIQAAIANAVYDELASAFAICLSGLRIVSHSLTSSY